jgi:hypothetical protein
MMANTAPITLRQLWRFKAAPGVAPHQDAAIAELEAELEKGRPYSEVMRRSEPWFSTWSQDGRLTDKPHPESDVLLRAPYFPQRDSATGQGDRMCFSSTCAMAAETLKPGVLAGPGQPDDRYLQRLQSLGGDTTDVAAQVRTLRSLGIEAVFRQNLGEAAVESELVADRPVSVGWLHHGPIEAPRGGGHWSLIVGATASHWILHDPFGEADLVGGGHASTVIGSGKFVRYSRRNFNRRWMVEPWNGAYRFAPGQGWGLLLRLM